MRNGMNQVASSPWAGKSGCLFFPKNHAMNTETRYKTIIGAAKSIMFGMSPVGDTTAATIKITTMAIFHERTSRPAEMRPIRDKTYVIAGIWKITPIASIIKVMKSK